MGIFDFWKKDNDKGKKEDLINAFDKSIANSQWREAITYGKELAQSFKNMGPKVAESACYMNLGIAYANIGDFDKAIEFNEKALRIARDIGDRAMESKCHRNLSIDYVIKNDIEKKEDLINAFDEAVANSQWKEVINYGKELAQLSKDTGDREGESICYTNLGIAYRELGNFKKAIDHHEKALKIAKDIGNRAGEAKCYGNLGVVYYDLGDSNKAIEFQEKDLEIKKDIGDRAGESPCYTNLGNAYYSMGNLNKAIGYYEKSLEIAKDSGDRREGSKCYVNLGSAYDMLGYSNKAIESYEKSLEIAKDIGDRAMEALCYENLGVVAHYSTGNFNKAIGYYEKSLGIFKDIADEASESICYVNLADIYYFKHDYQRSLDYTRKSIKITEQVRESLMKEELSLSFLKTKIRAYDLAINSAINLYKETNDENYLKDTLEIIERIKSRELIKIIKAKKKDPKAEKEYKELEEVEAKITELEAEIKNALEAKRSVEREVQEKDELYERRLKLYKKIREKSLDPSSIVPSIEENIIEEFWDVFEKYANDCTILQMYEQEERIIYIFFDKEKFEFFEKKITKEKIKELVAPLESMRSSPVYADTFYKVLKGVISDILPESIIGGLANVKTEELFIIPHRHLHKIPWEAVVVDEKPLCVKYNLIRHYSLDLIRSSLKYEEKENKNALLISNPKPSKMDDLEEAEKECDTINKVLAKLSYNPTHLSRKSAKIEDVESQIPDISIVHFSCHGLFNPKDPFESSIVLSSDNELSANRISLKNLDYYPLVFLNACETGITGFYKSTAGVGDEQIGLVRAFAIAHSPSIIVTGWKIDADVAEYFANKFYSVISKNNLIAALKFAREKTYKEYMNKSKDWAAYVLYGNPYRKL